MPETMQEEAQGVLERIRRQLTLEGLDTIVPGLSCTFSAGMAEFMLDALFCAQDWMRLADQALYQAKAAGRNQTVRHKA